MTPATPHPDSQDPHPKERVWVGPSSSLHQAPRPEARNSRTTPSPDSSTPQDLPTLTPHQADALAADLLTARPRSEIAAQHNLSLAQLGALALLPILTDRIAAISALFTLQNAAIKREQIDRLRVIANTSESAIEARRASMAILTQLASPKRTSQPSTPAPKQTSPSTYATLEDAASDEPLTDRKVGPGAPDPHPQEPTKPAPPPPRTPPPPLPDSDPDLLLAHQLKRFRDAKPTDGKSGFIPLYDYCTHNIKMGGEPRARFTRRLENSLLHAFLDHPWEQLPADKSGRIDRAPSPHVPDHRPLQTAIARIVIRREPKPVSIRFLLHLEQPYPECTPAWSLEDLVLETG